MSETTDVRPESHWISDLRGTLDRLRTEGDLIETDRPVDPNLEITGLQKHLDGSCPILFTNVRGKPNHRVVTNVFGDSKVLNKMFGWKNEVERTRALAYAIGSLASYWMFQRAALLL